MKDGKTGNAFMKNWEGKVLSLKDKIGKKTVAEILAERHPEGRPINPSYLVSPEKLISCPFTTQFLP